MRGDGSPAARTTGRRLALIYNPTAGGARGRRFAGLLARLQSGGCAVRLLATGARGDAERFAADAAASGGVDAIVAAGGDGTINEVVNGMAGSGVPLGILPLGTANVVAWELGTGTAPDRVADAILSGVPRRIHLGRCNGRYFVMMAGVGLDAQVVAAIRPWLKRRLGKLTYVLEGLSQIARLGAERYRVRVGDIEVDAASVIVCNGRFYAGRYVIAPAADLGDPVLHCCVFERSGRLAALRYSLMMVLHRLHRLPDIVVHPGTRIVIEGPRSDPIQGDGDTIGRLPAEITLADETIEVLVPPDLAPPARPA